MKKLIPLRGHIQNHGIIRKNNDPSGGFRIPGYQYQCFRGTTRQELLTSMRKFLTFSGFDVNDMDLYIPPDIERDRDVVAEEGFFHHFGLHYQSTASFDGMLT